jgi:2TM domain
MLHQTRPGVADSADVDNEREVAKRRVQARRDLASHVGAYIVVNAFLVVVWAVTGAGYFWPVWVIGAWGAGLVLHALDVVLRREVTDADIEAEIRRHNHVIDSQ